MKRDKLLGEVYLDYDTSTRRAVYSFMDFMQMLTSNLKSESKLKLLKKYIKDMGSFNMFAHEDWMNYICVREEGTIYIKAGKGEEQSVEARKNYILGQLIIRITAQDKYEKENIPMAHIARGYDESTW